jgi:hypothetical protein
MHPAHAAYVYAQNQVAILSERLTALPEMAPLADMVSRAEDLYLPSGPPMSPLTRSYFTCWARFDACLYPTAETIGTTILAVAEALGMDPGLRRFVELMQSSRMGLHVQEGREGGVVVLRELMTDRVCRAVAVSAYQGRTGDLWFPRVLPPSSAGGFEHVVFTTPYIVRHPGLSEWEAYFRRNLPVAARLEAYERHMKLGPSRSCWNEYVFEAYVGHDAEAVFLEGLPDVPESRPSRRPAVGRDVVDERVGNERPEMHEMQPGAFALWRPERMQRPCNRFCLRRPSRRTSRVGVEDLVEGTVTAHRQRPPAYLDGPGGGLVYVEGDDGLVCGVSMRDLKLEPAEDEEARRSGSTTRI